jgi:glutamine amidotransferase
MCRWLAYRGEAIPPVELVLHAKHSLVAQSLDSTLGAETVNGDGFGFGWYPEDERLPPGVFHSTEPAWNDRNLREITQAVTSRLFFSHVRAAAAPPIQQTNCHPFRHENWLFMHNGVVAGFDQAKRDLTFAVDPGLYPHILGTTDSEVLFYLALTLGLRDDPVGAVARAIGEVERVGHDHGQQFPFQGTVAVSDGSTIWAFRYSTQGRSRSLFHSADIGDLRKMYPDVERLRMFSENAHVVVSEPLSDLAGAFLEVPESTVAVLTGSGYRHESFGPAVR